MGETSAKGMENRTIQFTESLFIFNSTFSNLVCISVSTLRSRIGHGWMCNSEPKQTVPNITAAWPRLGAGGGVFRGVSNGVDSVDTEAV